MLKVTDLAYCYAEDYMVFQSINFEIHKGEFWGILGRNGAGKTTLMDIILGLKYPSKGHVKIDGVIVKDHGEGHPNIVFLSQDVCLKGDISITEFLEFNRFFYKKYSIEKENELLEYFELSRDWMIGALSTGQQKKVQIVAGLSANTDIILIDEITAVLDPETRIKFFSKILEYNKNYNKTIVLATNIYEDLKNRVDKVLYITEESGEVLEGNRLEGLFDV